MKIWAKEKSIQGGKFLVVRRDGSIPHWNHFVLGARDPWAVPALLAYAKAAKEAGADQEYVDSVIELSQDFSRYQIEEGQGNPDKGPHRVDSWPVVHAMTMGGGFSQVITVTKDSGNMKKTG